MDKTNNDGGVTQADQVAAEDIGSHMYSYHEFGYPDNYEQACIIAARHRQAAIAQHEGDEKPVAWMYEHKDELVPVYLANQLHRDGILMSKAGWVETPLYPRLTSTPATPAQMGEGKFKMGDRVRKTKGSSWQGRIVGFYSTDLTAEGYAVESEREPGSVQIYPAAALARVSLETGDTSHAE